MKRETSTRHAIALGRRDASHIGRIDLKKVN